MAWLTATTAPARKARAEPPTVVVRYSEGLRSLEVVRVEVTLPRWAGECITEQDMADMQQAGYLVKRVS